VSLLESRIAKLEKAHPLKRNLRDMTNEELLEIVFPGKFTGETRRLMDIPLAELRAAGWPG